MLLQLVKSWLVQVEPVSYELKDKLVEPCRRWKRCKDTRYEALDRIEELEEELLKQAQWAESEDVNGDR